MHQLSAVLRGMPPDRSQARLCGSRGAGADAPLQHDSRDQGWSARAEMANAEDGVWGCTYVGECSEVCPKAVDPAHAINQNKANSALDYFGLGKLLAPSEGAK